MNFWSLLLKILGWKIYGENLISPRSVIAVVVPINIAVLNFKKKEIHIFGPFDTKEFDVDTMFSEINEDVEMFGEARHTEKYLPAQSSDGETILTSRIRNFEDCDVNES